MEVEILATLDCKHCSSAVEAVKRVARDYPRVRLKVTNLVEKPEAAASHDLSTSPIVLVDGKVAIVGYPKETELRNIFSGSKDQSKG